MGKRLTDREVRAILKREAEADPDSWAAYALLGSEKTKRGVRTAQRGNLAKAMHEASKAEAFERQVVQRLIEPTKNGKTDQPPPESLTDTEAALREQLRTEHKDPNPAETASHTEAQQPTKTATGVL